MIYLILTSKAAVRRYPALGSIPGASSAEEKVPLQVAEDKSINIESHNQSGGFTGILHVQREAKSAVRWAPIFENRETDEGKFHTRMEIWIEAPYAADSLYVRARAASMERMALSPGTGLLGPSRETPNPAEPGVVFTTVPRPHGRYMADFLTGKAEDSIDVSCQLDAGHPTPLRKGDSGGGIAF